MNYRNHELLDELAAQYALGTLRGAARDRFERLLGTSEDARAALALWETLMEPLGQQTEAVTPPLIARESVLAKAFATQPMSISTSQRFAPAARSTTRRRRLRLAAAASVIGVVLTAIVISGVRLSFPEDRIARVAAAARHLDSPTDPGLVADGAAPILTYVAQVRLPASHMQWLISLSPDQRQLSITASDDFLSVGRGCVQLWWLDDKATPQPLAVLGTERDSTVTVDVPPELLKKETFVFAITIEPIGGSPTGRPTGPMLDRVVHEEAI